MKQRIYALMLTIVMVVSIFAPITAFATTGDALLDSGEAASQTTSDAAQETDAGLTLGESSATPGETCGPEDEACATPTEAGNGGFTILSGWEGGGAEFYTKIRLTVTDRNGSPIEGAVYGLYRASDDSLVEYLMTDSYGVAVSSDVPVDTDYYLLEYQAPEGFHPNTERKDIRLTEICAPSRVDETVVYDPILGNLKVVKTDEDGNPLAGAGFYVYRQSDWSLVDTIYTDEHGEAFSYGLRYGWYELYEFDVPEGFAGAGYTTVFVGDTGEGYAEISITNYEARGYAYVYKTGNDGRKISGAVFSVFQSNDTWIEDVTTSSSGYAYTSNLPLGDYYLMEKSVPAAYTLRTDKYPFTLSYDGQSVSFSVVNNRAGDPGRLKIVKTDDSANPVPLSGVTFGLYRAWDGYKLGELTTGADGTAVSGDLIPDDYYIVELTGRTGYTMQSGQIPFTVDGTGATVEKTVVNPKIRIFGKVKAVKADDAGNPIPGVRFGVYCHADNLLEEITTDSDGTAVSGVLNEGTGYYLKELEGAAGYLSDPDARYPFDITENNVIVPVNVTNPRISGAVKVIKTGENEETPLFGVVFGVFRAGTNDKVAELTTGPDGVAQSGTLYYGDYDLWELSTVDGYELSTAPIPFSITEQDVVIEIPVSNPLILGSVRIQKYDEHYEIPRFAASSQAAAPLAGATFGIYNAGGQKIGEMTTDADGVAVREGLPKGDYFLKELVAPEGFALPDELIPFSIHEQGYEAFIIMSNAKGYGTLNVVKHGENELLSGVTFEVYRESTGEKVDEITTGEDGAASVTLPLGRYYLKETVTAEGYILPEGTVSFSLTTDGETVELSLQNQKEPEPEGGRIQLVKKDADDGKKLLPGAVFGIYRASDDEKVGEMTTGTDGTAVSAALPEADYYLKELTAPSNYELSDVKTPAAVKNGETVEVTVTNKAVPVPTTGQVTLIKAADSTGRKLPGAVYGLYKSGNDEKVCELITGSDGTATSPALPEGDYYLKEIKAPSGFRLSADKVAVHIKAGQTVEITVTDYPEDAPAPTAKVKFIKKTDSGEKLKDAVFGIYRASDDVKVAELTTGSDGTATSPSLPAGDYYWKELKAPSGFKAITEKVTFTLKADEVKELTVTNTKLPDDSDTGTLLIVKKAERTGKLLADAVFGVYTASGNTKVAELTTASDGTASMELDPGDYYLRELRAPAGGYVPETAKIPFKVKTGATVKIELTNTQGRGTVKLLKTDESGKALAGGVFTLYRQDGAEIAEITSGKDGTATYELPIGGYYLLEKTPPVGFQRDSARYSFTIENGRTAEVKVINKAIAGIVEVYFRHVDDGRELAPMKSYTDKVGADYVKWMRDNGYENMPISGYTLIRTDYPSSFVLIDGKLVVTLWYDDPAGTINVPKTGETPPYLNYAFALLSWGVAGFCGCLLYRMRKQNKATKSA